MKEFLLIIKTEGSVWTDLTPEQLQRHMEHGGAYIGKLMESGTLKSALPVDKGAKLLVKSNGSFKDGPFNESKEVVAGYFNIKAESIEEAIEIAKKNPIFDDIETKIEIYPLMAVGG